MGCVMQIRLQYEKTWQECLARVQECKVGALPGPPLPLSSLDPLLCLLACPRPSMASGHPPSRTPHPQLFPPIAQGIARHDLPGRLP